MYDQNFYEGAGLVDWVQEVTVKMLEEGWQSQVKLLRGRGGVSQKLSVGDRGS